MSKQDYKVTRDDIEWVAGTRVQHDENGKPLPIALTEAQAAPELARGLIELAKPVDPADPVEPVKAPKAAKPAQSEG